MSNEPYRKERFVFRLIDIAAQDVDAIKSLLPGQPVEIKKWRGTGNYVVVFPIDAASDPGAVARLLSERAIPESKCGIWASLTTDRDSDGITVPDHVLNWSRILGGQFDFSFTSV